MIISAVKLLIHPSISVRRNRVQKEERLRTCEELLAETIRLPLA